MHPSILEQAAPRHSPRSGSPSGMTPLHVVILAAGQGKRMRSDLPKVLHPLAGRPFLSHVIDAANGWARRACTSCTVTAGASYGKPWPRPASLGWSSASGSAPVTPSRRRCPIFPTMRRQEVIEYLKGVKLEESDTKLRSTDHKMQPDSPEEEV